MSDLLVPSFLMSDVSKLLRLLTKNEQCEGISQVAHQKWVNEWIACFFELIAHWLIFSQKNERFAQKTDEQIPSPVYISPFLIGYCQNLPPMAFVVSGVRSCGWTRGSEEPIEECCHHQVSAQPILFVFVMHVFFCKQSFCFFCKTSGY